MLLVFSSSKAAGKTAVLVLAAAGKKSTTRPPLPLQGCGGEWKETGRKPVGRDKGSLTEQQTEGTVTTTIQKREIHKTNQQNRTALSDRTAAVPSPAASQFLRRPPPTGTQHDGTWYGIPSSVCPGWGWASPPGCAPSWILVKINPVLAEHRTTSQPSNCSQ